MYDERNEGKVIRIRLLVYHQLNFTCSVKKIATGELG